MTSTRKLHGYTDGSATVAVQDGGAGSLIYLPNGNSEDVVFLTDSQSVLDSLAGNREHRRVVLQWIPAHCDIKGNEHADRLAKQGANMEQEKLPITLKQKKQ